MKIIAAGAVVITQQVGLARIQPELSPQNPIWTPRLPGVIAEHRPRSNPRAPLGVAKKSK